MQQPDDRRPQRRAVEPRDPNASQHTSAISRLAPTRIRSCRCTCDVDLVEDLDGDAPPRERRADDAHELAPNASPAVSMSAVSSSAIENCPTSPITSVAFSAIRPASVGAPALRAPPARGASAGDWPATSAAVFPSSVAASCTCEIGAGPRLPANRGRSCAACARPSEGRRPPRRRRPRATSPPRRARRARATSTMIVPIQRGTRTLLERRDQRPQRVAAHQPHHDRNDQRRGDLRRRDAREDRQRDDRDVARAPQRALRASTAADRSAAACALSAGDFRRGCRGLRRGAAGASLA